MGNLNQIEKCLLLELTIVFIVFIVLHDAMNGIAMIPDARRKALTLMAGGLLFANYFDFLFVRLKHLSQDSLNEKWLALEPFCAVGWNTPFFYCLLKVFSVVFDIPGNWKILLACSLMFSTGHFLCQRLVSFSFESIIENNNNRRD